MPKPSRTAHVLNELETGHLVGSLELRVVSCCHDHECTEACMDMQRDGDGDIRDGDPVVTPPREPEPVEPPPHDPSAATARLPLASPSFFPLSLKSIQSSITPCNFIQNTSSGSIGTIVLSVSYRRPLARRKSEKPPRRDRRCSLWNRSALDNLTGRPRRLEARGGYTVLPMEPTRHGCC